MLGHDDLSFACIADNSSFAVSILMSSHFVNTAPSFDSCRSGMSNAQALLWMWVDLGSQTGCWEGDWVLGEWSRHCAPGKCPLCWEKIIRGITCLNEGRVKSRFLKDLSLYLKERENLNYSTCKRVMLTATKKTANASDLPRFSRSGSAQLWGPRDWEKSKILKQVSRLFQWII